MKIACLLLGHRYGEAQPANPSWVLIRPCTRGCAAVKVEMDEGAFARGGFVDASGVALIHNDYALPPENKA